MPSVAHRENICKLLFLSGPQRVNFCIWLLCKNGNHKFRRHRNQKFEAMFWWCKTYFRVRVLSIQSTSTEVGRLYLNQVLVHPFCEGLFLYSITFIYKKNRDKVIRSDEKGKQLHVRKTVRLIRGRRYLVFIDKIRKESTVQRYIPEQHCARLPQDLTQTVQFPNKKQQDLDKPHAHWDNRPACSHPVFWVLDSNRNHKVCHFFLWIQ